VAGAICGEPWTGWRGQFKRLPEWRCDRAREIGVVDAVERVDVLLEERDRIVDAPPPVASYSWRNIRLGSPQHFVLANIPQLDARRIVKA